MGILKSDILDRERGMDLHLARNEDILDDCSKESRGMHNERAKEEKTPNQTKPNHQNFMHFIYKLFISLSMNLDQKNICMRAYFFLRCVTIWNLVYDDAK